MKAFINWLAGPYPKWGTIIFMTLQVVFFWLAIGQSSKQPPAPGISWNIYWTLTAIMVGFIFVKTVVRYFKHGARALIIQEKW